MSNPITLLLVLAAVLQGALLAVQAGVVPVHRKPESALTSGRQAAPSPPAPAAIPGLPPLDTLTATVTRPLFAPSRQAGVGTGTATAAATQSGELDRKFTLTAIVIAGGTRFALIRNPVDGKTVRLKPGETLAGWRLVEVLPDHVVLGSGGRRLVIKLRNFRRQPRSGANAGTQKPSGEHRDIKPMPRPGPVRNHDREQSTGESGTDQ